MVDRTEVLALAGTSFRKTEKPGLIKAHGIHYTPPPLAHFLAALTSESMPQGRGPIRVLDPACGDGGLLVALSQTVPKDLRRRLLVTGYETDPSALQIAGQVLSTCGVGGVSLLAQDFLSVAHPPTHNSPIVAPVDAIIANPPYVRTQVLGASKAQQLAKRFGLSGRIDLYHAFVKAMAHVLNPGGVLGLLTSNRFLTVQSGVTLRRLLQTEFALRAVYDLGDTKLFSAAVLPVVLIGVKQDPDSSRCTFDRVYQCRPKRTIVQPRHSCGSVLDAVRDRRIEGVVKTPAGLFNLERGTLAVSENDAWSLATPTVINWLRRIEENRAHVFSDIGKVRVGIKTTADDVFIRSDWDLLPARRRPEETLLRPLITHHETSRWYADMRHASKRVFYPHVVVGGKRAPIDLSAYPRAERYAKGHEKRLKARRYVLDAGRQWYEIWVPQNPEDWKKPKIVYPDISEDPRFFLDTTGAVVNGDCYWITLHEGVEPDWLLLMLAVANSSLITRYYDAVHHNKLYSGRRRFMTQYVSGFPLPRRDRACGKKLIALVSRLTQGEAPCARAEQEIDALVWESFGSRPEEEASSKRKFGNAFAK